MATLSKEDFINKLRNGICEVVFTKADGSERVMKATLLQEVVNRHLSGNESKREEPEDVVTVIDTEKNDWRRFRIDSVKSFTESAE